jgi:hypothetical protein
MRLKLSRFKIELGVPSGLKWLQTPAKAIEDSL